MPEFAQLIKNISQTNSTNKKISLIIEYLANKKNADTDKMWAIYILLGKRPAKSVNRSQLKDWVIEYTCIPEWLYRECYFQVGDGSETITLLLPEGKGTDKTLSHWANYMISIRSFKTDEEKKHALFKAWQELNQEQIFVFVKLLSSSLRIGVSKNNLLKAIAQLANVEKPVITHRLLGEWNPQTKNFQDIVSQETQDVDTSTPYPFYLCYQLDIPFEKLGKPKEWVAEWKWDGIRGQIVKRENQISIWSRGEELINNAFPDLIHSLAQLPNGIVLDGEILAWNFNQNRPETFNTLQNRLGRKNVSAKVVRENPVIFLAYDLLEFNRVDIRHKSTKERQTLLREQLKKTRKNVLEKVLVSSSLTFSSWKELEEIRATSRANFAEGIMLKRDNAPYKTGRIRGDWWKWKVDPFSIDAVLIYAQVGTGRRAGLYTDYTFAIKKDPKRGIQDNLVTIAKAYAGLTDKEIKKLDAFIKKNTNEKFGPVRSVTPELVFEIGFEGIQRSARHKSGIALRFPRILRWRDDKSVDEIDSLTSVEKILRGYEEGQ